MSPTGAVARGTHPLSPPTLLSTSSRRRRGQESACFRPSPARFPGLLFFGPGTLTSSRGGSLCLTVRVLPTALSLPPCTSFPSLLPGFSLSSSALPVASSPHSLLSASFPGSFCPAKFGTSSPPPPIRSTRLGVGGDVGRLENPRGGETASWFPWQFPLIFLI